MNEQRIASLSRNLATLLLEHWPDANEEIASLTNAIQDAIQDWFDDNPEPVEGLDEDE